MSIRQKIFDCCEISKDSKIPFLLLSNPGYAKTTCIKDYANSKGYYLETLVGSRYSAEDISGYQVNEPGKTSLVHKNPSWFQRIWDESKKGKRTMLFIDELSTCNESVQGTLLTLIFDRTIGENKFLPEDTIIMSAANYAGNLNDQFDLLSPTINRFCVINLTDGIDQLELIDEFLSDKYNDAQVRKQVIDDLNVDEVKENLHKKIKALVVKYSQSNSSLGKLDLHNTDIQDLYRRNDNLVLNVMTGRSISYLYRVLCSMIKYGIKDELIIRNVADGLVGNGTCSFKEDNQLNAYRKEMARICEDVILSVKRKPKVVKLSDNLVEEMQKFIVMTEEAETSAEDIEDVKNSIVSAIKKRYEKPVEVFKEMQKANDDERLNFITFMDTLVTFISYLREEQHTDVSAIHQMLIPIYNDLSSTNLKIKDFEDLYGIDTPKFVNEIAFADVNGDITMFGRFQRISVNIDSTPKEANLGNIADESKYKNVVHIV